MQNVWRLLDQANLNWGDKYNFVRPVYKLAIIARRNKLLTETKIKYIMKKITLCFTLFSLQFVFSQIALEHTYPNSFAKMIGINLSNSGFKYRVVNLTTNQVILYNLDHSIFKTMSFSTYPGANSITVWYVSENTFDLDNEVEFMAYYGTDGPGQQQVYVTRIYNETGTILFEKIGETPVWVSEGEPYDAINAIYSTSSGTKMILNSSIDNSANIYSLPGSLPLAINEIISPEFNSEIKLFPNPTKNNKISIAYTLPENVKIGKVNIYNTAGQIIKTFNVDNNFSTIELNTENLASGTYVCEVLGNSKRISTSQFIVQN